MPVTIVTLVLEAPALDDAPRGTGVLVSPDAGVAAKGLTHATAKWEWLEQAVPGRHVVRLSYGRGGSRPDPGLDTALADASVLLGVPLARTMVRGWARTRLARRASARPLRVTGPDHRGARRTTRTGSG